ncbi:hypothetical protein ACN47E_002420 [Coniothyrium glycines]
MESKNTTDTVETTGAAKTKAQILTDVFSLASQFSTCVEAFNQIHPAKDNNHEQKVALAKLGLQQGRLLIFGDAVGISAPPATIARHMIPSHPGLTNPDPHLPVNFGVRDPRLDNEVINAKVRKALHEIAGRPSGMSREDLMNTYGMKSPKTFSRLEYPALDTNRLEASREKYALLQDLLKQTGARANLKRSMSLTTTHWVVKDSARFESFVKTVRTQVDALIDLFGVREQVDRGTRSDIRCMAWHPELSGPVVQQDWEKLRLIKEACEVDYPEYVEVCAAALQYINEELKESSLAIRRASLGLTEPTNGAAGARRKSDYDIRSAPPPKVQTAEKTHIQLAAERALDPNAGKEKRPGWLSAFKLTSWSKSSKDQAAKESLRSTPATGSVDPQRSLSEAEIPPAQLLKAVNALEPVRSKSVGAIPEAPGPLDMDTRMRDLSVDGAISDLQPVKENGGEVSAEDYAIRRSLDKYELSQTKTVSSEGSHNQLHDVSTVNSLIDRHDKYPGVGRIETRDIRNVAHDHGLGRPEAD